MFPKETLLFTKKPKKRDSVCNCIRNISHLNEQRAERVLALNPEEKKFFQRGQYTSFSIPALIFFHGDAMEMTRRELCSVNFLNVEISWICADCQSVSVSLFRARLPYLPVLYVSASDLCLNHFQDQGLILLTRAGI